MSLIHSTAAELLALQAKGEASAEAITDAFLAAIRDREPKIKAFTHLDEAGAREQARAVDAKRKRGDKLGALAGVPSRSRTCSVPAASRPPVAARS